MKHVLESIIVVIRSATERTHEICSELVLKQVPADRVSIVQECPFEAALRKCYRIGIESNAKWMITIDADILLTFDAIESLFLAAENMPDNYFQLQGRIFDKVTGMYRQAGHRIYRTKYLPEAMNLIPDDGVHIRPEYFTLQRMEQLGYPFRCVADVVGLHDFEQYYGDLYRKSFVHAIKHKELITSLVERCSHHLHYDADFLVILKALWDGLLTADAVSIDKSKFHDRSQNALLELGLSEKAPIHDAQLFTHNYDEYFSKAVQDYPIPEFICHNEPVSRIVERGSCLNNTIRHFDKLGPIKGSISAIGILLKRIGQYLDS